MRDALSLTVRLLTRLRPRLVRAERIVTGNSSMTKKNRAAELIRSPAAATRAARRVARDLGIPPIVLRVAEQLRSAKPTRIGRWLGRYAGANRGAAAMSETWDVLARADFLRPS